MLNQLLLPTSAHPSSVTLASVFSHAIRYRRICCTDELFDIRAAELKQKLLDYSETAVDAGILRAKEEPRDQTLERVERPMVGQGVEGLEGGRQHRLVVEFDRRSCPALGQILRNNYEAACSRDTRFRENWSPGLSHRIA